MIRFGGLTPDPAFVEFQRAVAMGELLWLYGATVCVVPTVGDVCAVGASETVVSLSTGAMDGFAGGVCGWVGYSVPVGTANVRTDALAVRIARERPEGLAIVLAPNSFTFNANDFLRFDNLLTGKSAGLFTFGGDGVATFDVVFRTFAGSVTLASLLGATSGQLVLPAGSFGRLTCTMTSAGPTTFANALFQVSLP